MIRMICLSNEVDNIQLYNHSSKKGIGKKEYRYKSLSVGKIYDVINITGQVYINLNDNKLISAVTIKIFNEYQNEWTIDNIPISLFMDIKDFREQQINKILY
jgi:hypothetical protein